MSRLENLERLARLKEQGVLTEDEFLTEKAQLLSEPEDQSLPMSDQEAAADPEFSWNPFRPVSSPAEAIELTKAATFAAIAMALDELITLGLDVWAAIEGRILDPEFSNPTSIGLAAGGALLWSGAFALAAWWIVKRHSRTAALILLALAVLGLIANFETRLAAGGLIPKLSLVVTGGSILLAIQAVRGVYGVRGFGNQATTSKGQQPSEQGRTAGQTLKAGIEAGRPVRRAIRWIGLGLIIMLSSAAAFVWFSSRQPSPVEVPSSQMPQPVPLTSPATLDIEFLEDGWEPERTDCHRCYFLSLQHRSIVSAENYIGSWTLEGDQLRITNKEGSVGTLPDDVGTVRYVADNEIEITWNEDGPVRYRRSLPDGSTAWAP